MHTIVYYVPKTHLEVTKQALFAAGAGELGGYAQCCWQVLGQGQFFPKSGSHPHIGKQEQLEIVDEYRVELVCRDEKVKAAITALEIAHPYETPAIMYWLSIPA